MIRSNLFCTTIAAAVVAILLPVLAVAQATITTPDGQTIVVSQDSPFGGANRLQVQGGFQPGPGVPVPNQNPGKPPENKKPPKDGEKKPEGEKPAAGGEKKGPMENVKRTSDPPKPANPDEFDVAPDEEGLLYFQFRNQPWPDVLRWYADVSQLSFDWQELPGDYINLATQRPHSLEETGDMINRALLMRGFTMLQNEETLTVAKIEGLNPSLVPRVPCEQLRDLPPHKFVRTTFPLTWLLAEQVSEEFKSMISKNGSLTPLQSTNRLEAMDAVANLSDIYDILQQEQSALAMEDLAKEFPLQYARASSVKQQLEQFLGIQSSSGRSSSYSSSSTQRMMQQMQQMQQQMQKQMQAARGNKSGGGVAGRPRSDQVYLVANDRSNSLIVHAEPNKMALIASFIRRVDVPNENSADFTRLNTRMKVFRLASLGPQELVDSLTAMDVLEPGTRLQVDQDNNAIIAYASVADQYLIQSVIDRLDGSERSFEVVQLRRLDAESVAGSIKFLMGAEEEDNNNNRRRYYDPWSSYSYGSSSRRESNDKMRVGANVQDNQLLLWVNEIEMQEIQNLLVKLGEIPAKGSKPSTVRVIDASRQPKTYEYLKRLKEQWDRVSPNPLIIPDMAEFQTEETNSTNPLDDEADSDSEASGDAAEGENVEAEDSDAVSPSDRITANEGHHVGPWTKLTSTQTDTDGKRPKTPSDSQPENGHSQLAPGEEVSKSVTPPSNAKSVVASAASAAQDPETSDAPEVEIFLDEGGNLVLRSNDTDALDRLEQIMQRNKPPQRPYDVFEIKHARASWVSLNLEEYFDKQQDDRPSFFAFFDGFGNNNEEEAQLGDKQPLRFIWDNDTNTIVVQGADDIDRQTIEELIELWDVPEKIDKSTIRFTKLVKVKYSRAENIVNTIKEAYRDLLSANDKTFQEGGEGESESKRSGGGGGIQGGGFSFGGLKGKLSLGPDALTNSILISVEGEDLLKIIEDIIQELDEAAKDSGAVEVYQVGGGLSGRALEKALRAALTQSTPKPAQKTPQQPGQNQAQAEQTPNAVFEGNSLPRPGGRSRSNRNR